jgi:hypothetical protein
VTHIKVNHKSTFPPKNFNNFDYIFNSLEQFDKEIKNDLKRRDNSINQITSNDKFNFYSSATSTSDNLLNAPPNNIKDTNQYRVVLFTLDGKPYKLPKQFIRNKARIVWINIGLAIAKQSKSTNFPLSMKNLTDLVSISTLLNWITIFFLEEDPESIANATYFADYWNTPNSPDSIEKYLSWLTKKLNKSNPIKKNKNIKDLLNFKV